MACPWVCKVLKNIKQIECRHAYLINKIAICKSGSFIPIASTQSLRSWALAPLIFVHGQIVLSLGQVAHVTIKSECPYKYFHKKCYWNDCVAIDRVSAINHLQIVVNCKKTALFSPAYWYFMLPQNIYLYLVKQQTFIFISCFQMNEEPHFHPGLNWKCAPQVYSMPLPLNVASFIPLRSCQKAPNFPVWASTQTAIYVCKLIACEAVALFCGGKIHFAGAKYIIQAMALHIACDCEGKNMGGGLLRRLVN